MKTEFQLKSEAISNLCPNGFAYNEVEITTVSDPVPTDAEVDAELVKVKADYEAKKYQRDRAEEYPQIGDQLDMLYHAIDAGKVDKTSDFYKALKAVKDKHPKG